MLVIGNGESRAGIDINAIDDLKIGCNAIHRDFNVDHLVCVDKRMVQEAISQNITNPIYTRSDWIDIFKNCNNVKILPPLPYTGNERYDEPFQWGSGPYAVLMGAKLSINVSLIGFDLYSENNTVNNIYKSTPNYDDSHKKAVDPRYWIHQIGKVFELYRKRDFTIYQKQDWQLPKAWNYPNVKVDTISSL